VSAVREVLSAWALVTCATIGLSFAGRSPAFADHVGLAVGALFLWTALHMSGKQPDGVRRNGLSLAGLLEPPEHAPSGALGSVLDLGRALLRTLPSAARESLIALTIALLVFPPFVVGFQLFHAPSRPFSLQLPEELAGYLAGQLMVVALPEEGLFRGYVQTRLGEALGRPVRVLGATLSWPAWLLQGALFALIHFAIDLAPARLAVFFPALLFGWLRAWRGGIGAAAAFHALCNLLSDVLVRSWL
jgi:membrane protease YdiL (CAAX protease family)